MAFDFEEFRRPDKSIDLVACFGAEHADEIERGEDTSIPVKYLKLIENYFPIKSRQIAATALANADVLMMEAMFRKVKKPFWKFW